MDWTDFILSAFFNKVDHTRDTTRLKGYFKAKALKFDHDIQRDNFFDDCNSAVGDILRTFKGEINKKKRQELYGLKHAVTNAEKKQWELQVEAVEESELSGEVEYPIHLLTNTSFGGCTQISLNDALLIQKTLKETQAHFEEASSEDKDEVDDNKLVTERHVLKLIAVGIIDANQIKKYISLLEGKSFIGQIVWSGMDWQLYMYVKHLIDKFSFDLEEEKIVSFLIKNFVLTNDRSLKKCKYTYERAVRSFEEVKEFFKGKSDLSKQIENVHYYQYLKKLEVAFHK